MIFSDLSCALQNAAGAQNVRSGNMGCVEDQVRELISDRYGSVPKFAKTIGVNKQTIYSALRNGLSGASLNTVMPLAQALQLDPFQLAQGKLAFLPGTSSETVNVPLLGSIVAGKPDEPGSNDRTFPIPASLRERYPRSFLMQVNGESMNRVLPNGSYALINPCPVIDANRQVYALRINSSMATIKRVVLLDNGLELQPDSYDPTFKSRVYDFGEPGTETVAIIGRVVWYCLPPTFDIATR